MSGKTIIPLPVTVNPKPIEYKRVGIYCRVSTKSQEQMRSLRTQISTLVQTCNCRGDYRLKDIYVDTCSGDDRFTHRPEFSRMLEDVKRGKINYILTKSSSRFGRDTLTVLKAVRMLREYKAEVYFDTEEMMGTDPQAEFLLTIRASVNQMENENRSGNIRWGIHRAVVSGKSRFFNVPCYGYRKGCDGELEVNEEEAEVVRNIYAWRLEGKSIPQIAESLCSAGVRSPTGKERWCNGSIDLILTNRKYTGVASVFLSQDGDRPKTTIKQKLRCCYEYRMTENNPSIISAELFEQVQPLMRRRQRQDTSDSETPGLLEG